MDKGGCPKSCNRVGAFILNTDRFEPTMIRYTLLFFCIGAFFLSCQKEEVVPVCTPYEPPAGLDTYIYPLRPGTPEWVEIQTGEEKYAVTQIPDSVLQTISTEGLLETWLTYPLLYNIIAWNTLQEGIDNITEIFGGLQELGRRPNAGTVMLNRYRQMDPHCANGLALGDEVGEFTLRFAFYKSIFAQEVFLHMLSASERGELMDLVLDQYAVKASYSKEIYSFFSLKCSTIIAARLMRLAGYTPFTEAIAQDDYLRVFVEKIELQGQAASIETTIRHARIFNQQK